MTSFKRSAFLFTALPGLALLLVGCTAAGLLNTITPSGTFDRETNIAYGEGDRSNMDVYRAADPKAGTPVIVFVHGGGWTRGDKGMYKFVAEGFTKEGYDVVLPNYRLYPDSIYPSMVVDTGAAINATAEEFPDRPIVLIGHSAGAYNVLMAVMAPDISKLDVCSQVSGVVSLSGPTGAYPMTDSPYTTIFPELFKGSDAPMGLSPDKLPPVWLVNGGSDTTVGPANATLLAEYLEERGLRASSKIYEEMNHIDPVRVLSRHFDGKSSLKGDLIQFIDGLPSGADHCVQ